MPRINLTDLRARLKIAGRNPRVIARVVLGTLVAANLVAAIIVFKPWSGSAEELERQAAALRTDLHRKQATLDRLRSLVSKVQAARGDGDRFMGSYLLSSKTVASRLAGELNRMAVTASIRQKEVTFSFEPVEGSDTLTKAGMTANYEGTYADLMHFLNLLDRSKRLLIIDSLAATPQTQGLALNITMKLITFVREGAETSPADEEPAESPAVTAEPAPAVVRPAAAPPRVQPAAVPGLVQVQGAQPVPQPGVGFAPAGPPRTVQPPVRRRSREPLRGFQGPNGEGTTQ